MVVRAEIRAREHHARHGLRELLSLLCESCTWHSLSLSTCIPCTKANKRVGTNLDPCFT